MRQWLKWTVGCAVLALPVWLGAQVAPAPTAQVTHYDIQLTFQFPQHQLAATAQVALTATQPTAAVTFALNSNLRVTSVTDPGGDKLATQRTAQGVNVTLASALEPGASTTLTFAYAGPLATAELSPITGIRTAYVGPHGAFLLYPGEWFPLLGYGTNRFTMTVSADLPAQFGMVASGRPTAAAQPNGAILYTYTQTQPTFPGSVVVTALRPVTLRNNGLTANFYFGTAIPADLVQQYGEAAGKIFAFLAGNFGNPPTDTLHFIALPDDSLPSFSSPNMIFLSRSSIGTALNYQLLMDEIAQQWFGVMVSPATLNDAWLQYGAARFCEALYVQQMAGQAAFRKTITDFTVGALSYPQTSLADTASLYPFSPQFQDLTYDKGAMVFHMLRWQLGEQALLRGMRQFLAQYAWKSATTQDFEAVLEKSSGQDLRAFFTEWYRGTGAPKFNDQYVIYRLGNLNPPASAVHHVAAKADGPPGTATPGFSVRPQYRVTGTLKQQLDLFDMPVELQIETDGATVRRRVQVQGPASDYSVETSARPRKVVVDPNDWLLKETPALQVRVLISRGDNDVAGDNFPAALKEYRQALTVNPISSLAHYRIAEAYYLQQNWQSAANEYRAALDGDLQPAWVAVWSHIQLGKIFDMTGQRNRAINEYQLAIATQDNTQGAQVLARQYLRHPYKPNSQN
ncbi:MAG: M1 family aminopeptidase [Terriglobales bacterium]